MTTSIATRALAEHLAHPAFVVVDVREMAAFNGWPLHGAARGGHIRGAVAFPLEWTAVVTGAALQRLLASKGITPRRTAVVYDVQRERSAAMAHLLRTLGYARVLTYDAGVAAWAAEARLPMAHLPRYEKLVHPAWVCRLIHGQRPATYTGHGFVVCAVGWDSATAYHAGHIPGARYFALDTYEYAPLWTRVSDATLAARLRAEGVRYDTTVVLYSDDTTAAARAAVLLMDAGINDVRVLDGGLAAWRGAGYPVETTAHHPEPLADFGPTLPRHPEYLIGTEERLQAPHAEGPPDTVAPRRTGSERRRPAPPLALACVGPGLACLPQTAPLADPGGVLRTRHSAPRTAAFRPRDTVGFPLRTALRDILLATTLPIAGLHHAAGLRVPSSFVRP